MVQPASACGAGMASPGPSAVQVTGVSPAPHRLSQPLGEHSIDDGSAKHPGVALSGRAPHVAARLASVAARGLASPPHPAAAATRRMNPHPRSVPLVVLTMMTPPGTRPVPRAQDF